MGPLTAAALSCLAAALPSSRHQVFSPSCPQPPHASPCRRFALCAQGSLPDVEAVFDFAIGLKARRRMWPKRVSLVRAGDSLPVALHLFLTVDAVTFCYGSERGPGGDSHPADPVRLKAHSPVALTRAGLFLAIDRDTYRRPAGRDAGDDRPRACERRAPLDALVRRRGERWYVLRTIARERPTRGDAPCVGRGGTTAAGDRARRAFAEYPEGAMHELARLDRA